VAGCCGHGDEPSGPIQGELFLDKLGNCQLMKGSAALSKSPARQGIALFTETCRPTLVPTERFCPVG